MVIEEEFVLEIFDVEVDKIKFIRDVIDFVVFYLWVKQIVYFFFLLNLFNCQFFNSMELIWCSLLLESFLYFF